MVFTEISMVDFFNITNFHLNDYQLQEHILAWVAAAGHNGPASARAVDKFLKNVSEILPEKVSHSPFVFHANMPFSLVRYAGYRDRPRLSKMMSEAGIGCSSIEKKGGTFWALANAPINLRTCTREDLCEFKGIGMKTASCFILHSRPDQQMIGLDRHVLAVLREKYPKAPKQTPGNVNTYKKWEQVVLDELVPSDMTPAEFDLKSWVTQRAV